MKPALAAVAAALLLGTASAAFADDAPEIFAKKCATCHGKDGKGKTRMGEKTKVKDLSNADEQQKLTDAAIVDRITNGIKDTTTGKDRMPPYKARLTVAEINALIPVVRALVRK